VDSVVGIVTSNSKVISSIVSLFVGLFNILLITLIVRREYWIKRRQIGFWE
jgi:hypothetical protein